jgi:hypothetical protein
MGEPTKRQPTDDRENEELPGAVGYPQPGSGHDDSETTTVAAGPPRDPAQGVPGACGHADGVDAPLSDVVNESPAQR